MIPEYEDSDSITNFTKKLAENFTALNDTILALEHQVACLKNELGRYKRMYCREVCKQLYSSGAMWKISPNPMRSDGVFIEEDCEPGQRRTHFPFPHQFAHDDAKEIVFLLNRATRERNEMALDRLAKLDEELGL
jgi:hypothetical protein